MSTYIQAIHNLRNSPFSRDCYFYYVLPEDQQKPIAEHFNDANWLTYVNIEDAAYRQYYIKTMFRQDDSDESSSDDSADADSVSSKASYSVSDDETSAEDPWIAFCPYSHYSHKRRGDLNVDWILVLLLAFLLVIKLNLNEY